MIAASTGSLAEALPLRWLGAPSPGGLALPAARPTGGQLYAPRGVWIDERRLIVCDSGNHRILIWNGFPETDHAAADVVLGQASFTEEGPAGSGRGPAHGLHLPTGVIVVGGEDARERLVVADAWHHRILVWEGVPERSGTPPDYCIGQRSLGHVQRNRGRPVAGDTLFWPYGIAWIGGRLHVADTGNRRVLIWEGLPRGDRPADLVLGQDDGASAAENRGGPVGSASFRWPHAIAGSEEALFVADAGNHRVLGWNGLLDADRPADICLGQADMASAWELPHGGQGARRLRFPYCVWYDDGLLAVADTANNRVLFWRLPLAEPCFTAADAVIGQPDFLANGENHWRAVTNHSLCWPYAVCRRGERLAVADTGNNRVMIWQLEA
jgi:hypothetical protein